MKNKKIQIIIVFAAVLVGLLGWTRMNKSKGNNEAVRIIKPHLGKIQITVSSTGTVLPKNRLEVKAPVNGRIEEVLIKEGQRVKTGDIVAWMSSTDRAALLDAARGQGEEKLEYWQEVYKAIPISAPIDGEVIVGTIQPGQTITTSDAVIVLSDRLIVRGQVDETDIGKIKEGQKAVVSLDAYPETKINAEVDHIYYESKTVNNVTIYEVDLITENIPDFFRSGMNANIEFIKESRSDILVLPLDAVHKEKGGSFVLVKPGGGKETERAVTLGISDDKNVEIMSGLTEDDEVVIKSKKYALPQNSSSTNPFMPQRRRQGS